MSEPIAQRTLVKSPPELWAEISDVEALARHLGAFGEIRITRVVPETTVSWEGETARGTVELAASGWGTKVTLRATATGAPAVAREGADELPPNEPSPDADAGSPAPPRDAGERILGPPSAESHWAASADQKVRDRYIGAALPAEAAAPANAAAPAEAPPAPTAQVEAAPDAAPETVQPEATAAPRGFFARIRWWFGAPTRHDAAPTSAAADGPTVLPFPTAPATPDPLPEALPAAAQALPAAVTAATPADPATADVPMFAGDPASVEVPASAADPESVDEGTIVGILTGVLDELGSAHHRPFSRG